MTPPSEVAGRGSRKWGPVLYLSLSGAWRKMGNARGVCTGLTATSGRSDSGGPGGWPSLSLCQHSKPLKAMLVTSSPSPLPDYKPTQPGRGVGAPNQTPEISAIKSDLLYPLAP